MTDIEKQILENQLILMKEVNLIMQQSPTSRYKKILFEDMLERIVTTKEVLRDD